MSSRRRHRGHTRDHGRGDGAVGRTGTWSGVAGGGVAHASMTGRGAVMGGSGRSLPGRIATSIAVWTTTRRGGCEMEPSVKCEDVGANRFGADTKGSGKGFSEVWGRGRRCDCGESFGKTGLGRDTLSDGRAKLCSMINWRYKFSYLFRRYMFE